MSVLQYEKNYGGEWWLWLHNILNVFNTAEVYA